MEGSIRRASLKCRNEKRMDTRMDSRVGDGRKVKQMQVHLLRMREFPSMRQGHPAGVGEVVTVTFGKGLPQGLKMFKSLKV